MPTLVQRAVSDLTCLTNSSGVAVLMSIGWLTITFGVVPTTEQGLDYRRNSLAEFAAYVRSEVPKLANAVKSSGAKVE